ncbi:MAG: magnesium transporter [Desulfobacterales bacterium]|jgi:magnesium transporter|nr:magnesium transporter [Desulfobacterales bacterium]MDP6684014.1 magnesium transporter [Desulfobacterales bacterium]MDP6806223.1 magnesium transporter [Desulfobacterales bacterium]|tara:strand:+ start:17222 stop:18574 length:1353 start_codon:yes stop_codon:yes gene_type:complete
MQTDRNKILVESIKRLLRRGATSHLIKIVNKTHAADLSMVFRSLSLSHQRKLFGIIEDTEQKGILFTELDEDTFLDLVEGVELDHFVEILEQMPTDDVADLIGRLPEKMSDTILEKMKVEGSEEVEDLLRYKDDTAGGIMLPDFIALAEDTTAKEAIESLQKEHLDVEMPFYLYVVDRYDKLVGVISLRQLVVVPHETTLRDFMTTDVFSVQTDMDQEEVAKIVARYDILAVPVVDGANKLVGIVTVDDVIDIFRREATEDMLKMAGAGEEFVETKSVLKSTRIRLPWLFASCLGGIIAFLIIGHFEGSLSKLAYLAAFIPVIMGMGGNIGTQSSTIVVRGLATGRLQLRDIWSVVSKELAIGLILGLVYGIIIGMAAQFRYSREALAVSVGIALICSMSIAALVGSLVPMAFARVNIDPAVASGPFVTTAIDIISVFFYFQIATTLLGL